MKPKVILLDVGGVIVEIDARKPFHLMGIDDPKLQADLWVKVADADFHQQFERGEITEQTFFSRIANEIPKKFAWTELRDAWNSMVLGPLPNVEKIFDEFGSRAQIVALSNTNLSHYKYIFKTYPIFKRFDRILLSFELGHRKPEPECFRAAVKELAMKPEQCIFIDDNIANIDAAKSLGMRTGHSINSVDETLKILRAAFD
jgi:HAD superfamily hydrolase (TIGR01509 family)